jgi:nitrilase
MTKVASIQMVSTANVGTNLDSAADLIAQAANQGAEFLVLPEDFALMGHGDMAKVEIMEPFGNGPIQDFLKKQASTHAIWLQGGTIPLQATVPDKTRTASLLFNPQGQVVTRYDKIHLFDVIVDSGGDETYCESNTIEAGNEIKVTETPFGNVGMSVCYDLRFPEFYRNMHAQNVNIITVTAAFTETTGRAHWETLLRTRAVENLSYVIASSQGGTHDNDRRTWGHSMVIDPWGEILAEVETGPGFACAEIDLDLLVNIRQNFPAISHRKINYSV